MPSLFRLFPKGEKKTQTKFENVVWNGTFFEKLCSKKAKCENNLVFLVYKEN